VSSRRFPVKWIAGAALLAAVVLATRLLPVESWLRDLQDRVHGMGAMGPVVYALVYVVCALAFVPGSVLTLGAGLVFGLVKGTLVVIAASNVAAVLAFLIARHVLRERVEALASRDRRFGAIDAAIREEGWKVVALLRLSPLVPFSLSNYLYGLTPVALGPYALASFIGMLPATVLYVYVGAASGAAAAGRARSPLEWALLGVGLLATVAVTVVLTRKAQAHLRQREAGATGPPVRPR
jgi:uncharacterized membrane protein YdjX (TVP38/TMEM64 family)